YQNDTTIYARAGTHFELVGYDPDQNFINYDFTSTEQLKDFEVVSGSWSIDTTRKQFVQIDKYTSLTILQNWHWPERYGYKQPKEYELNLKLHISSYYITNPINYINSINSIGGALIYFKYQDKNNFYAVELSVRTKQLRVIKRLQNVEEEIIKTDYPFELDRWYDVSLKLKTESLEIRIFGEKILTIPVDTTDLLPTSTIGIGSDEAIVRFSDIKITRPALIDEVLLASGLKDIYYSINDSYFAIYSSTLTSTEGIHSLKYYAIDNLGNLPVTCYELQISIDGTTPVSKLELVGIKYESEGRIYIPPDTKIVLSSEDPVINGVASGVKEIYYSIDNSSITPYRLPLTLSEGIHTIKYYSVDNVNNTEFSKHLTLYVDATPPITLIETGSPKYITADKTFVTSQTKFSLTAHDPVVKEVASGVAYIEYRIDSGNWIKYIDKFSFQEHQIYSEGTHSISYYAVDNVGNIEQYKSLTVIVDNTPPITTISISNPKYSFDNKLWVSSNTQFSLSAIDGGLIPSGVKSTEYKVDNGLWQIYDVTQGFKLAFYSEGYHTISYRSVDNVNNLEQEKTLEVIIDNSPPETSLNIGEPKYNEYVTSNSQFTFFKIDLGLIPSGVQYTKYRVNPIGVTGEWLTFSTTFYITGSDGIYEVQYYSVDNVENQEVTKSTTVKLDNTPPVSKLELVGIKYELEGKIYIPPDTKIVLSS
ncbi:MAG: hypothetical protein QME68_07200, partial [Elusimicrobiota bacterium]|nr:hypothetical protein [Elusimicrobiota bacterium]